MTLGILYERIIARPRPELVAIARFAPLIMLVSIVACAVPGLKQAHVKTYLLEWDGDLAASAPYSAKPCASLLMISPLAAPGYATAQMAYVEQDHRLDYFATHRWADTPARMLSPLMSRALQTSGLFRAVVQSPAPINAQLRLETEVLMLRQVFGPDDSKEQLSLKVELFDLRHNRLLITQVLRIVEPAETRDPYGGVVAANRAVNHALAQLGALLAETLAANPQVCGKDDAFSRTRKLVLNVPTSIAGQKAKTALGATPVHQPKRSRHPPPHAPWTGLQAQSMRFRSSGS